MQVATLIYGTGSVGPFASRAFVPAFITAAMMRFAPGYVTWFNQDVIANAAQAPGWFTSNTSLIILGLLSLMEVIATKSPDLRAGYQEVDKYLKSIVAVVTYLGIAGTQDMQFIEQATQQAGMINALPAMLIGVGVFWVSSMRSGLLGLVVGADEDDDIGVQKLFSWGEDIWSVFGTLLLVLFPVVMLLLVGVVAGLLAVARRRAQAKEEKTKTPCANCGEMIYGCAVSCPACQTAVAEPRAVGFLGQSRPQQAFNLIRHPYSLVEKKRCPVCATRFEKRTIHQTCTVCGHELMRDPGICQGVPGPHRQAPAGRAVRVVPVQPRAGHRVDPRRDLLPHGPDRADEAVHPAYTRHPPALGCAHRLLLPDHVPVGPGRRRAGRPTAMALINYSVYRTAFRKMLNNGE